MSSDSLAGKKPRFMLWKAEVINPYVGRKKYAGFSFSWRKTRSFRLLIIQTSEQCLDWGCGKSSHFTPIMDTSWGNHH